MLIQTSNGNSYNIALVTQNNAAGQDGLIQEATELSRSPIASIRASAGQSADDWTIVGEPREVQEKILEYQERLGMTHLIASRGRLGSITAEEIETSIELLAEVVQNI